MSIHDFYFNTNKATWNEKVKIHSKSDMYHLEGFKKGKLFLNVLRTKSPWKC